MSLAKDLDLVTAEPLWVTIPDADNWWSDEPELETHLHLTQIVLLLNCLQWWWRDRRRVFISANISIYYEKKQGRSGSHRARGPDFFVVKDVSERQDRRSWMIWQEDNRFPDLIIEILSKSTAKVDKTDKKRLYQNTFKTPEYFWFHPWTLEFAGFRLANGRYQPIAPDERDWLWSEELQLFLGIDDRKLRFFTPAGERVPTPAEAATDKEEQREAAKAEAAIAKQQCQLMAEQAEQERQQAEQERQQREQAELVAEQERQQREQAEQKLAELEAQLAKYRQRIGDFADE